MCGGGRAICDIKKQNLASKQFAQQANFLADMLTYLSRCPITWRWLDYVWRWQSHLWYKEKLNLASKQFAQQANFLADMLTYLARCPSTWRWPCYEWIEVPEPSVIWVGWILHPSNSNLSADIHVLSYLPPNGMMHTLCFPARSITFTTQSWHAAQNNRRLKLC